MLAQLSAPTVSTNGNGHTNAVKLPKQQTPSNEITALLAQRQAELLRESIDSGVFLTGCYGNWFESNIDRCRDFHDREGIPERSVEHFDGEADAWRDARELFFQLAHVALRQLAATVADEIERKYKKIDAVTAADVSANLRNTSTTFIVEHYQ